MARPPGVPGATAVLILRAIPAVVLAVFNAPMQTRPAHDFRGRDLVLPQTGEDEGDVGGFFDDLAPAHALDVFLDADELRGPRQAEVFGGDQAVPEPARLNATVVFLLRDP